MPRILPPHAARRWWRARTLLPVLFALLITSGTALAQQLCEPELRAAVPAAGTDTEIATALARAVVEAIEPALPRGREASNELVELNARWLSERRFLPGSWKDSEPLTPQAWASLLAGLQTPYKVKPLELPGERRRFGDDPGNRPVAYRCRGSQGAGGGGARPHGRPAGWRFSSRHRFRGLRSLGRSAYRSAVPGQDERGDVRPALLPRPALSPRRSRHLPLFNQSTKRVWPAVYAGHTLLFRLCALPLTLRRS